MNPQTHEDSRVGHKQYENKVEKLDKQTSIITYRRQHQRRQVPQCGKEQCQGHGNREGLAVLNELLVNGPDEQQEQPDH